MKQQMLALGLAILMVGCRKVSWISPTPTPLPGWHTEVYPLLLEDDSFPRGWTRQRTLPVTPETGPPPNHVYRSWWWEIAGSGSADQAIWRSYTVADAEKHYAELRVSQFWVDRTPRPPERFVPYAPPAQISFQSQLADEWYLACGYRLSARCIYLARYRNYVVVLDMDRQAELDGVVLYGLSYPEIESLVVAADARFAEFLRGLQ